MKVIEAKAERFFWIDIHYACFGIMARDGVVVDAAPIARWMVGKALVDLKPWLRGRRAVVKEISLDSNPIQPQPNPLLPR